MVRVLAVAGGAICFSLAMNIAALSQESRSAPAPEARKNGNLESLVGPSIPPWDVVGRVLNVTNNGSKTGYGTRLDYFSSADAPGFDLATADLGVARSTAPNHTNYMSHWFVQVSPLDDKHFWTATIAEMNPVNRGDDPGWTDNLGSLPRLTGGLRVVPESTTFGEPGTGRNIEYAFAVSAAGSKNAEGDRPASYNGLMIETNSIAASGRGILAMGSSQAEARTQLPEAPIEIRTNWRHGITTTGARFSEGDAIHIGTGQAIALTDDGSVSLKTNNSGTKIQIMRRGKPIMSLDLSNGDLSIAGRIVQNADLSK